MCSFGTAPSPLRVTSQQKIMCDGKPAGTIQDATPANMGPFGMCTTPTNPAVAAATAAALGVLTPQPCTVTPAGTWIPTKPKILVDGKPVLTQDCKCMCAFGGSISIVNPGQVKTTAN
ncbi:MAG: DUF4280 domain-containing protein [Lachnospiraceae bacterium]|nr:DUF4280 domain-containing protein [Lachnospiraceae bacterium]